MTNILSPAQWIIRRGRIRRERQEAGRVGPAWTAARLLGHLGSLALMAAVAAMFVGLWSMLGATAADLPLTLAGLLGHFRLAVILLAAAALLEVYPAGVRHGHNAAVRAELVRRSAELRARQTERLAAALRPDATETERNRRLLAGGILLGVLAARTDRRP